MSGIADVVVTAEHPRPDDVADTSGPHRTDAVDDAISALREGDPVVLVDDTGRHPCGELVFAASLATTAGVSFAVRHTSGLLQVALSRQDADRLELPPISRDRSTPGAPEYGVAVDTAESNGTGISAADRARTIALLGDPTTAAEAFARPGHVLTYRAHDEGVLGRLDAGEAALDLVRLAGAGTGAARACLVSDADPTAVQRLPEARAWAHRHGLVAVTTSAVLAHRLVRGDRRAAAFQLTIRGTDFDVVRWRRGTAEITALVLGDDVGEPPIIHDECLHCLFDPDACRCRAELTATLRSIAERGRGLVLYRHRIALPDNTSPLAERLVP